MRTFPPAGRGFGSLRRALPTRIAAPNEIIGTVVARYDCVCVDLYRMAGAHDLPAWPVDHLHPSEAGWLVPAPVSPHCAGSKDVTTAEHIGWLVIAGIPWLIQRDQDVFYHALSILWRARWETCRSGPVDSARGRREDFANGEIGGSIC